MESHDHMDHNSHDEIHLPDPSIAPLIVAAGMTFALVGLLELGLLILGVVLLMIGIALWIWT